MSSKHIIVIKTQFIKVIIHELILIKHRYLCIRIYRILLDKDLLASLIVFIERHRFLKFILI